MDNYNEIRPPPGFEHLFPVVEFPESRDYLVRIDDDDNESGNDSVNGSEMDYILDIPEGLPAPPDSEAFRAKMKQISLIGESDDESSDGIYESDAESENENENDSTSTKPKKRKAKSEKVKWSEDINRRKIFVGNVPFNCSQEEFEGCFVDVPGVYKADIVKGYRDDSRGIGFVTMNSIADAEDLKSRDDIKCKGRILRFYPYQNNAAKNATDSVNNYVYIDGIPEDKDRAWLKQIFSEYQPFHRYFIAVDHITGERKATGFVDIVDDYKYERLLSSKFHAVVSTEDGHSIAIPISDSKGKPKRMKDQKYKITDTNTILTVSRYRQKTVIKNKHRKSARKDQLLSAMIIEEHKGHARERSGKRFRR